ncbi:hypothetical protein EBR16_08685, partial [bacterium]|nr:hypothetical protein [bacterium]
RIRAHLGYALSQQNNHGISESLGLFTAGALWPGLPASAAWRDQGLETLFPQVDALVAPEDGGFSQHSSNYHRLFLQLMTWAEVVLAAEGGSLPPRTRARVGLATGFLANLLEPDGTVPRYGADDSADLFPLSGLAPGDFRPAVVAAQALFLGERPSAGPWDEAALLLVGPMPLSARAAVGGGRISCPASGVGLLRHPRGTAFFRAPMRAPWRHRPSQADQLHVSLRWEGEWLAEDVGTYTYAGEGPDDFGSALHHNVVTVDRGGCCASRAGSSSSIGCAPRTRRVAANSGGTAGPARRSKSFRSPAPCRPRKPGSPRTPTPAKASSPLATAGASPPGRGASRPWARRSPS